MKSNTIKNLSLVMWDLDGTILDSREQHFKAADSVLRHHGLEISRDYAKTYYGQTAVHIFGEILGDSVSKAEFEQIIKERDIAYRELISKEVKFLPGVKHWLEEFYGMGIPQVITSSTALENIKTIVESLQAEKYFFHLFSGEDLPSKPDPAVFSLAVEQFGVCPEDCLVFEDSPHGVEAAESIGTKCIASTITYPRESLSAADIVIENLGQLRLKDIQRLFADT